MLGVSIKSYDDSKMKLSVFTKMAVYINVLKELSDWIKGSKNEKLDKWFSEYGLDFV